MTKRIWDDFLTPRDREVLAASGYGVLAEFGRRPALLVIDVNWAFCGDRPEPIMESIKRWRTSCGEESWQAVAVMRGLIDLAHAQGLPVIYTTGAWRADGWDAGSWKWKNRRSGEEPAGVSRHSTLDGNQIVDAIAPAPQDIVVPKQKPSAFFGTSLAAYLTLLGCDSLIVAGGTTSGCVRATVLDAFSMNYHVNVVEDACFDRCQASHAMSLCDLYAKYANVLPAAEVIEAMRQLPAGMFELPAGRNAG